MNTTLTLFIWLLYIAADVAVNYYLIEKKHQRPDYMKLFFMLRGPAFILWGAYIVDFQYDQFYLNYFLFAITSFWLIFDPSLNLARGKEWYYVGPTSGWIDRFGARNEWTRTAYWIAKLLALYVLVQVTINIYKV